MDFVSRYLSNGMTLMIGAVLMLIIAYRFYSAFLAARVVALDSARTTPAHRLNDGQNYHPTNKWVLFGHHFAAIAGAGPLIGPVLAAQFGYLPSYLWILIGVCLAGAVQDFTILVFSTRRNGKSLAQLAYLEAGPIAGAAATIGILFVLVIALAGLGKVVTKALGGEQINYPEKTEFVSPDKSDFVAISVGNGLSYRIPPGTVIKYPGGAQETVVTPFQLETYPLDPDGDINLQKGGTGEAGPYRIVLPGHFHAARSISGSAWGTFTIVLTIPIALLVGWYMYRFRKGRVVEASIVGGILTLGAVYLGGMLDQQATGSTSWLASFLSTYRENFNWSEGQVGLAMAVYGFVASILPVWILLCPRDYLSSFLKIGTIGLLVIGVIIAHPHLHAPPVNHAFINGGPAFNGALFPFVFIVVMCGAISGFHALVSSGTTPKMIDNEKDARMIGYGAMLIEGLVGICALIAACSLPTSHYYHITTSIESLPKFQQQIAILAQQDDSREPPEKMSEQVGENVQGRTSGAVTLAVGMARIFDTAARNILGRTSAALDGLVKYWYHFAIMFEALFILTTIDTGTRVGRFLLQETMGKWIHPALGKTRSWPSAILATALMVAGWWYFMDANAMQAIWPMFGIANQMLAVMALAIATVALAHMKKTRYLWVTLLPMAFVVATTCTAAVVMLKGYYTVLTTPGTDGAKITNAIVSASCILAIVLCTGCVVVASFLAAGRPPRAGSPEDSQEEPLAAPALEPA